MRRTSLLVLHGRGPALQMPGSTARLLQRVAPDENVAENNTSRTAKEHHHDTHKQAELKDHAQDEQAKPAKAHASQQSDKFPHGIFLFFDLLFGADTPFFSRQTRAAAISHRGLSQSCGQMRSSRIER